MGEVKNNRTIAFEIYREANGNVKLIDIAAQLQIPEGTIRGWKAKDKWNEKLSGTFQEAERSTKKRSVPKKEEKKPEKVEKGLTDKEELFCLAYVNNFNAASAVIKAGYDCKDRMTASKLGYKLLLESRISKEITRLKAEKAESIKLDPRADIIERYMRIAFADMSDFVEFGREEVPVMTMHGPLEAINPITGIKETVTKKVNCVKLKESTEVDGGLICQIKQGKDGTSIKLEDRQKALDWLASYFELNPMDKHKKDFDKRKLDIEEEKLAVLKGLQNSSYQNDEDRLTDEEIQAKLDEIKSKQKEVE